MVKREQWKEINIKDKIAYISAIGAFIIGWGLTIAGFIVPPIGMVSDSVLWVLGQSLVYAASVFGVGMYVSNSVRGMKRDIKQFMREEHRQYHNEEEQIEEEEENGTDA